MSVMFWTIVKSVNEWPLWSFPPYKRVWSVYWVILGEGWRLKAQHVVFCPIVMYSYSELYIKLMKF